MKMAKKIESEYFLFKNNYGKYYYAKIFIGGKPRILRKKCQTAEKAISYGNRVLGRCKMV